LVDPFQFLISLNEQFAPGSSSEVLITSADSRIRVVDGVDLVHKFKGMNKMHQMVSSFVLLLFYLLTMKCLLRELFVLNLIGVINMMVPPKVDAFLYFLNFSMVFL
jgi:hypothetical protein